MSTNFIRSEKLQKTLADETKSIELVQGYFRPLSQGGHFEGGAFDTFPPGEDNDPNMFTAADLLACTLLSAQIKLNAVAEILIKNPEQYNEPLRQIDLGRNFIDEDRDTWASRNYPGRELYRRLRKIYGIGEARATKLMARKRPDFFPIVDKKVRSVTVGPRKSYWAPFRQWLEEDNNYNKLESIRSAANLEDQIAVIRVFDVIAWLVGSGKDKKILQ